MKIVGVIPARYGSTRFPGKPLALLQGRPLIAWTIEGAKKSKLASTIIVATDDERIAKVAKEAGVEVVMTDSSLPSGSDRVFAAIQKYDCDVAVNIQGDEPLVTGELIDLLAQSFINTQNLDMATLAHPLGYEELLSANSVKVILNQHDEAIYFSRFPIPYSRVQAGESENLIPLKHIGMYAYTKEFLGRFCQAPPAGIETRESLEQLRALYLGAKIKVLKVADASIGVDTPEDLERVQKILAQQQG